MSFSFKSGDIIKFEYDSIINKMTVAKNKSGRYEMDIERDTSEKYAVCAYLYDIGDSVEISDWLTDKDWNYYNIYVVSHD